MRIRNNVDLEDLDGLCNLKDVTVFSIEDCPKLRSLRGLRNIRTYENGAMYIEDNSSLPPEEAACLRKALRGIVYIISDAIEVECPAGYWGEDTP